MTTKVKPLDPAVERLLREFVERRIEYIRTGNRRMLNRTYDLGCRNEYNRHDYDWYMRLIEFGFGAEVQHFEISHAPELKSRLLPLQGITTYPWAPEYVVSLTSVSQRRTLWLVHVLDGVPRVVLPAFNGSVGDAIACGEYGCKELEERNPAATNYRFDEDKFAAELAERIYLELNGVKLQLRYDVIRALAIDCFPWFGYLHLSILTDREDFSEGECGKWAMAEWRYQDFPSTPNEQWPYARDLIAQMKAYYESAAQGKRPSRANAIWRACAKALRSTTVARGLRFYGFNLAADFEFGVFDPDHPEKGNFCAKVRTNRKTPPNRKGRRR